MLRLFYVLHKTRKEKEEEEEKEPNREVCYNVQPWACSHLDSCYSDADTRYVQACAGRHLDSWLL